MSIHKIGRLAFRAEGDSWNAYWCPPRTSMRGAVLLGSILMRHVQREDRKRQFMSLMSDCFGDVVEETVGHRPGMVDERPAPEHERSGTA